MGMLSWGPMFIPIVTIFVLLLFFQHRTKWWEVAIPLVASVAMIGAGKYLAETIQTRDVEFWGGWVTQARYYEAWDEYIHQTCSSCISYDKDGFCTSEITYDCSYVRDHPEYWEITDSNYVEHGIAPESYDFLVRLFGAPPAFHEMNHPFHSYDGDMYYVNWPNSNATVFPVTTAHVYENRVQASRSVFNYSQLSKQQAKEYQLFEYPPVQLFHYPAILGDCGPTTETGDQRLRFHNAVLGSKKQLRMWILCTPSVDPQWGQLQESYWAGGNKNEAVLVIGKGWDHIFTWAIDKAPLLEVRDFVKANFDQLDLGVVADKMGANLARDFQRRHFTDFSYLTIEPPVWAILTTYVLTLLINVGLSFYVIHNEWRDSPSYRRSTRPFRIRRY